MSLIEAFHTDRLRAERLQAEHLDALCHMHQDPRVMATLGGLRSDDETRWFVRENLAHWDFHGFGLWVFQEKGRFVGRGGLRHALVNGIDEVELAYALMTEYWGRGLATEIARASLAVGFERLGLKDVVCFTLTTNRASQQVMEKVGFTHERNAEYAGLPHTFYRLTAAEYQALMPPASPGH